MICESEHMSDPFLPGCTPSGLVWRHTSSTALSVTSENAGRRRIAASVGEMVIFDHVLSSPEARHLAWLLAGEEPRQSFHSAYPLAEARGVHRCVETGSPAISIEVGGRVLRFRLSEEGARFFAVALAEWLPEDHLDHPRSHSLRSSGSPTAAVSRPDDGAKV